MNPHYNPSQQLQMKSGGYLPPAQYGGVQAGSSDIQSLKLEIKALEKSLTSDFGIFGWWLKMLLILSLITTYYFLGGVFNKPFPPQNRWGFVYMGLSLLSLWTCVQSFFGIKALEEKNIRIAHLIYWVMLAYWAPAAALQALIVDGMSGAGLEVQNLFMASMIVVVVHAITFFCMMKVRKILIDREVLVVKIHGIDPLCIV